MVERLAYCLNAPCSGAEGENTELDGIVVFDTGGDILGSAGLPAAELLQSRSQDHRTLAAVLAAAQISLRRSQSLPVAWTARPIPRINWWRSRPYGCLHRTERYKLWYGVSTSKLDVTSMSSAKRSTESRPSLGSLP